MHTVPYMDNTTYLNNTLAQMNSNPMPLHDSKISLAPTTNSNDFNNTPKEKHFIIPEELTRGLNRQVAHGYLQLTLIGQITFLKTTFTSRAFQ